MPRGKYDNQKVVYEAVLEITTRFYRFEEFLYCLRFFGPLPKTRLCYNTISLKGVI